VKAVKGPVQIETVRLVLVRPQAADAASIFERYASDPDVTRFLGWPRHQSVADTETFLRFSAEEWERWPAGPYLIRSRDDGRLLGGTGLGFEAPQHAVTGYVLAKDAWGKGYATEALAAMSDLAGRLGAARLYALCHPEHRASWRVLEKCGFVRDRTWTRQTEFPNLAPGVLQDVFCYAAVTGDSRTLDR
jgi:RimJ/RimL family protein N-acetyltransferase